MNADELRKLAKTLNGIADGQPWQFEGCEFPWIDAWKHANPISVITDGLRIRLKPWALGRTVNGYTLPPGREWHRQDFTQEMLPAPYRPLMDMETEQAGDEGFYSEDWYTVREVIGNPETYTAWRRTTRPISVEPVLTPEQIADGWIEWHGGECPVEPASRPIVKFRSGGTLQVCPEEMSRERWGHKNLPGDITAYKPDPLGHIRQAIADGKAVQWKVAYAWNDYTKDNRSPGDDPHTRWRIKPADIPLGPEDVPPFSVIRRKGQTDEYGNPQYWHWRVISYVTGMGPVCADRGYNWQELSTDYEINRSLASGKWDPTAWEPCRKEAP